MTIDILETVVYNREMITITKGENYSVADDVLEAKEVAKILKVHQRTVIRLAERGELASFRIGDLWRFNRSDVEAYIESQKAKQHKKDQ